MIDGIDVYDGNGPVRWGDAAAAGIGFGVVKASEGDWNTQTRFAGHRAAMRDARLPYRLSYHFCRPDRCTAAAEAAHYAGVLGRLDAGETWALDLEDLAAVGHPGWPLDKDATSRYVAELGARMRDATGRRGLLYMNQDFLSHRLGAGAHWDHAELWLAWWNPGTPALPFTAWQHGVGASPITNGATDLNRADERRLAALTAGGGGFLMALTDKQQDELHDWLGQTVMYAAQADQRAGEVLAYLQDLSRAPGSLNTIDGHLAQVARSIPAEVNRALDKLVGDHSAPSAGGTTDNVLGHWLAEFGARAPGMAPFEDLDRRQLAAALRAAADTLEASASPTPA